MPESGPQNTVPNQGYKLGVVIIETIYLKLDAKEDHLEMSVNKRQILGTLNMQRA